MRKKFISAALSLMMLLSCLPAGSLTALADDMAETLSEETQVFDGTGEGDLTGEEAAQQEFQSDFQAEENGEQEENMIFPEEADDLPAVTVSAADEEQDGIWAASSVTEEEPDSVLPPQGFRNLEPVEEEEEEELTRAVSLIGSSILLDRNDLTLYSDEEQEIPMELGVPQEAVEGADYEIRVMAGIYDKGWTVLFPGPDDVTGEEIPAYTYDAEGITLNGSVIWNYEGIANDTSIRVYAALCMPGNPDNAYCSDVLDLRMHESEYEYEQMDDMVLLSGDSWHIDSEGTAYVWNANYPNYAHPLSYDVVGAAVVSQKPEKEGETVLELWEEHDPGNPGHHWWIFSGCSAGSAQIEVAYLAYTGEAGVFEQKSYTFAVTVTEAKYHVNIRTGDGSWNVLPGGTVELYADVFCESVNGESADDVYCIWSLTDAWREDQGQVDPHDYAVLENDDTDSGKAVLHVSEWEDEPEDLVVYLDFEAAICKGEDESGEPIVLESGIEELRILRSYTEIWPTQLDADMPVGEPVDVTAELRTYPGTDGEAYDLEEGWSFSWSYDSDVIKITDPDGNVVEGNEQIASQNGTADFVIERLDPRETSLELTASGNGSYYFMRYRLNACQTREPKIWIEWEDDRLYSDGTLDYYLRTENLDDIDWELELNIGQRGEDKWDILFKRGVEYDFDEETGRITLYGDKILAAGADQVHFYAGAWGDDEAERPLCEFFDARCDFRIARTDYEMDREWDRDMLIGWDEWVDRYYGIYVEDAEHPDGEWFHDKDGYEVTDVRIRNEEPWDNGKQVIRLDFVENEEDPEHYGWNYRALNYGKAEIEVAYKTLTGETEYYTFTVTVSGDVYGAQVVTASGGDITLPYEDVDLYAFTWHNSDDEERDGNLDGISYEWRIVPESDPENWAELRQADDGPFHAILNFSKIPEDERDYRYGVRVEVIIYDGFDEDGQPIERTRSDMWINVAWRYLQVEPVALFDGPLPGQERTDKYSLMSYRTGREPLPVEGDLHFRWYYDSNAIEVRDKDGNLVGNENDAGEYNDSEASYGTVCEFTVKRLTSWGTGINLYVEWFEEEEDRWHREEAFYWLDDQNTDIWFDWQGPNKVFSDGSKDMYLRLDNFAGMNYNAEIAATIRNGEELTELPADCWSAINPETDEPVNLEEEISLPALKIVLDGEKIWDFIRNYDTGGFDLTAVIRTGDTELARRDCWIEAREEWEDLDLRDQEMLTGWDRQIDRFFHAYVENSEFPDGGDFDYEVTDVRILSGEDVISLEKEFDQNDPDSENYWWRYRAQDHGEAEIEVTFKDYRYDDEHPDLRTETFRVYVMGDVYDLDLWHEGSGRILPGGTITLHTNVRHHSEDPEREGDLSGVTRKWELFYHGQETDFAELTVDESGESAEAAFNNLPDDWKDFWEDFQVVVTLYDGTDEDGKPIERARRDIWLNVSDDYPEINPAQIDSELDLGQSLTESFKLLYFRLGEEPETIRDVHFRWYYDENAVEILDENGQTVGNDSMVPDSEEWQYNDSEASYGTEREFTIRRLGDWDTNIHLEIDWFDEYHNDRHESWDYHLNRKNYDFWFEEYGVGGNGELILSYTEQTAVYDDYEKKLFLNTEQLGDLDCEITYEVGNWNWNEETQTGFWNERLTEGNGYTVSEDGLCVTIDGETIAGKNWDGVNVRAVLTYEGEEFRDFWCWVELRNACGQHQWRSEETVLKPGCVTKGMKLKECRRCGEERWTETEPTGHSYAASSYEWADDYSTVTATALCTTDPSHETLTETVSASGAVTREPTIDREGEMTYTAVFTNALFSEQKKKVPIPKLDTIPITESMISDIAVQTYAGKPLTPAVKVTCNGSTLKAGTDYKVAYENNNKAGAMASAIVTGQGKYSGTAAKKFRIQFSDVTDPSLFYYDPVYWAADGDITTGYKDGTFGPLKNCNRAAVVTFLWRIAGSPEPVKMAGFKDLPTGTEDFDKAISWAVEQGITTGWDDNTFRPWNTCNRAAIVTFLWRFEGKPGGVPTAAFKDMTGNADFDAAISWASSRGITTGYNDNTFRPWNTCNRLAVVSFLYRNENG